MRGKIWIGALASLLALSACGETPLEQVLYGAGAGAIGARAIGGDAATGALVGAGVNVYCQNTDDLC